MNKHAAVSIVVVAAVLLSVSAHTQSVDESSIESRVAALEARVAELEKRAHLHAKSEESTDRWTAPAGTASGSTGSSDSVIYLSCTGSHSLGQYSYDLAINLAQRSATLSSNREDRNLVVERVDSAYIDMIDLTGRKACENGVEKIRKECIARRSYGDLSAQYCLDNEKGLKENCRSISQYRLSRRGLTLEEGSSNSTQCVIVDKQI